MPVRSPFALVRFLLLSLVFGTEVAQGCSITLISAAGTDNQGFCSPTLVEPIEPIVYVIDDTGYNISGLPPGISALFVNDTLTISGTLTGQGYSPFSITTDNGCIRPGSFDVAESVDPEVTCTADGQSVTISWAPWLTAPLTSTIVSIQWFYDGSNGNAFLVSPVPSTYTIPDLPPGTEVTVLWYTIDSHPYCTDSTYHLYCSTTPLGLEDHGQTAFTLSPNPAGQFMQLSGVGPIDRIRIYDLLGHEVVPRMIQPRPGQIDVSFLAPGVYTAQISSNGSSKLLRFIKE